MDPNRFQQNSTPVAAPAAGAVHGATVISTTPATETISPDVQNELRQIDRPRLGRTRLVLTVLVILLVLAMLIPVSLFMFQAIERGQQTNSQGQGDFTAINVPLGDLVKDGDVSISANRQVNINGQLRVNNSLVLSPSAAPTNPLTGQLYLDDQNNQLYYYNGTAFIDVATGAQITQLQSEITSGGSQDIAIGAGLGRDGGTLINTGVLALPQDLLVSAAPTFAGLNLGSALTVANGGTGAVTAEAGRINLGAAGSGTNSDISTLDALTAINPNGPQLAVNGNLVVGPTAVPANSVLTVGSNTTTATGGITFGTDTNLYRQDVNTLRSDGAFQATGPVAFGLLGVLENTGPDRSTLNVQQGYTDMTGINNVSSISSLLQIDPTADTSTNMFAIDNQLYVNGNFDYSNAIIASYSYTEKQGDGDANSLVAVEGDTYNFGNGNINYGAGAYGYYNDSSQSANTVRAYGLWGEVVGMGGGTIQNAAGVSVVARNEGTGTFTNGYGVRVESAVNSGGGTFTNNYGVYIQDQSGVGSTNSFNLYSAGANAKNYFAGKLQVGSTNTASRLNIGTDADTTAAGGVVFGTDTNLYRGAANVLRTDDNLLVRTAANSTTAFQVQNAANTPLLTADTTNMQITVQALAVTGNLTVNGHIITGGGTPSTAVNANAGVGASCVVSGTDTAGSITITTGSSGVVAGTQCTVTFSSAFGAAPRVVVGPSNAATAPLDPYIGSTATGNFTVGVGTAGSTSTAYKFDYVAAQ